MKPADARRGLDDARAQSLDARPAHGALLAKAMRSVSWCWPPRLGAQIGCRKDLVELGTHQAAFFPRLDGSALTLSWVDELLFACLDKDWMTPVDVFIAPFIGWRRAA